MMAIYHLSCKTASRVGGQSALAHFSYIARSGKYANRERDRLIFCESGNLPQWSATDPSKYWQAADQHERANGRLYKSLEFALPIELTQKDSIDLAKLFINRVTNTADGKLPFSFALHEGKGHNPHVHLMISERIKDGHDRDAGLWFKRAAPGKKSSAEGGAKKTRSLMPIEWLISVRELWATLANTALDTCKSSSRIDHRSHKVRGIQTEPGIHMGPRGFKNRRPLQKTETAHQKRTRQLEIIRISRDLDELKSSESDISRQASRVKFSAQKSLAPARTAPVPSPKHPIP
jgi:hypothetical protein